MKSGSVPPLSPMFQDLSKAKWSEIHSGQSPSRTLVSSRLAKGGIKPNLHSPRIDVLILTVHIVASCSRSSSSLLPIIQTSQDTEKLGYLFSISHPLTVHQCTASILPAFTCKKNCKSCIKNDRTHLRWLF